MSYHPDDILRLLEAVENGGGAHLPDACKGEKFRLPQPDGAGGLVDTTLRTVGCGQEARLVIRYDPQEEVQLPDSEGLSNSIGPAESLDKRAASVHEKPTHASKPDKGSGFCTVCINDDMVGHWPRYQHLIEED